MKRIITFNIWDFIDITDVNGVLDDTLLDDNIEGIASDISYKINNIDKDGNIKIESEFTLDTL